MSLVPIDERGHSIISKLPDGKDVKVEVRRGRNLKHLRLYWAIVDFLREHVEMFENKSDQAISTAIKIGTGLGDTYVDMNTGERTFVPGSIAFDAMEQGDFSEWFDAACKLISDRWMKGNTPEEIRRELLAMIEPQGRAA